MRTLNLLSFMVILMIVSSCANVGVENVVNVPKQDVSFIRPASSWERFIFTSTSEMPTGEKIPVELFLAVWRKSNNSSIGITGFELPEIESELATKDSLVYGLKKEADEMSRQGVSVDYTITGESNGVLRDNINYSKIEADYICVENESGSKFKIKTVLYGLNPSRHYYSIQYKALESNFKHDISALEEILNSITFGANSDNRGRSKPDSRNSDIGFRRVFSEGSAEKELAAVASDSYKDCLRKVNDPNTIVYFALIENKKTEEYCRCVEKTQDWGKCFTKVLQ